MRAQHAVEVGHRIDVAGAGCVLHVDRQVARVAAPDGEVDAATIEGALRQHRRRQDVGLDRAFLAVEVVAEHDRPSLQAGGEALVEIEPRAQAAVGALKFGVALELAARQRVERLHPGLGSRSAHTTSKPSSATP